MYDAEARPEYAAGFGELVHAAAIAHATAIPSRRGLIELVTQLSFTSIRLNSLNITGRIGTPVLPEDTAAQADPHRKFALQDLENERDQADELVECCNLNAAVACLAAQLASNRIVLGP